MGDFDGRRSAAIGFSLTAALGFLWLGAQLYAACDPDGPVTPLLAPLVGADEAVEAFLRAEPGVAESFGALESIRRRNDQLSLEAKPEGTRFSARYELVGAKAAGIATVTLQRAGDGWRIEALQLESTSRPSAGPP